MTVECIVLLGMLMGALCMRNDSIIVSTYRPFSTATHL